MTDKTYNGWTNYETWNVALWLDNEQGSSDYWREMAQEYFTAANYDTESATHNLKDMLRQSHEEAWDAIAPADNVGPLPGVFADLMGAALSEVNWYEIAGHYIAECEVEETA